MKRISLWVCLFLFTSFPLWQPPGAFAQKAPDEAALTEAKHHFEQGVALYNDSNFSAALAEFQASYKVSQAAGVLYNIGLTQKALFRYSEAIDSLTAYLAAARPPPKRERRAEVEQIIAEMKALLAEVRLQVAPPGASVQIDGRPAGIAPLSTLHLPAGQHAIEVTADGYRPARKEILVTAGVALALNLSLQPIPRTGMVHITASRPQAMVKVDGKPLGLAPVDTELLAGGHTLSVSVPGYNLYQSELVVTAGQRREVPVVLTEMAHGRIYQKWWFWTIIGTAVAGGVAAAVAVPLSNRVQDPLVGTLTPGVGKVN